MGKKKKGGGNKGESKKKDIKKTLNMKKSSYYKIDEKGKATKLKKTCPKCGPGVFMGEHKERYSCGLCGYTEWKKKEEKKE